MVEHETYINISITYILIISTKWLMSDAQSVLSPRITTMRHMDGEDSTHYNIIQYKDLHIVHSIYP